MRTLTIWNNKGGVFKSSICHNLAYLFARDGLRVLLIDLDQQASLTISAGQSPDKLKYTTYNFVADEVFAYKPAHIADNVDLLGADLELSILDRSLSQLRKPAEVLKKKLEQIKGMYDVVIIDNAPSLTNLVINAVTAADYVIVPCEAAYLSYKSLSIVEETLKRLGKEVNAVICTRYDNRTSDCRNVRELLEKKYNCLGVIRNATAARECLYEGLPIVEYNKQHKVSLEYEEIYEKLKEMLKR